MNLNSRKTDCRECPKENSNFLNKLFFGWMIPIIWKGLSRDLELSDLYEPSKSNESEILGDRLEREWKKELMISDGEYILAKDGKKTRNRKPNLLWPLIRMFWAPFMLQGLKLFVLSVVLRVMQPILQSWVIRYFNPGDSWKSKTEVLVNTVLLSAVNLGIVFMNHHANMGNQEIGMRMRVACCSMIYRKVLRLDKSAVNNAAAGQVANLISNDVARFDLVLDSLHYIWIMPIQVLLMGYVVWEFAGIAALVGIGVMVLQTAPAIGYLGVLSGKLRSRIAVETDKRIQLMGELISGIKVLKMYSWEKPFELIVSKIRKLEMKGISHALHLKGFYTTMIPLSPKISLFATLVTFYLMGSPLTAEITFLLVSLFNGLRITLAVGFPIAMTVAGEAVVSLDRITQFLLSDEVKSVEDDLLTTNDELEEATEKARRTQLQVEKGVGIKMTKVAANWVHGRLPPTLCEISLQVKSQSLCVIVGHVGSGKSSLLHLVLGELPVGAGSLSFFTGEESRSRITSRDIRISYTSQEPWLFNASVRDNIVFDQPYEEKRYQEVIRVCALRKDFEQLPQGDLSFVGENGVILSGGQRARVNLARAVYRDADLYLLDDPLSAVDPRVGRHLFEECITGFLKDKTRILVTHQLQYLRHADRVLVLNRGTLEHQGTYEELVERNLVIPDLGNSELDPNKLEKVHDDVVECRNGVVTANEDDKLSEVSESSERSPDISKEVIASGKLSGAVYWGYFLAGGSPCTLALLLVAFIAAELVLSGSDYWFAYWTNQETLRVTYQRMNKPVITDGVSFPNATGTGHQSTEWQWFDEFGLLHSNIAVYVYTISIIGAILLGLLRSVLFMKMCAKASRRLHDSVLNNLLQATMRFFNTNPSGRILNRFSMDMGTMDELLPKMALDVFQSFVITISVFLMVAIVNYWTIVPGILIGGIILLVQTYFLKTAQGIMRLEGITKSPVFSHVNSTLDGLSTIRSRGAPVQGLLLREFDHHQDVHTGAWYLTVCAINAFALFIGLISCIFIACVCFSFILMDEGDTLPGFVGLAISQSLLLIGVVQFGIKQSTQVLARMVSVERILQYTKLPREGPFTTDNPPEPTWPQKGGLVFKNVTMRYADHKPPVLTSVNVTINPGWKVGIVGRTGAGKSSLISALFRLTGDGLEGEIVLDGIDTKLIGLHELRPRISIIPQEPILFSASLRYNLDPFEQYSDAELWDSLREVELGDAVPSLDFLVAGGGANFSVGQRQLICLARAILRNNRVLVLDEATANVDKSTDTLIQKTIRRRFADCTVLTIAHRLNTIMDSDRILVMAAGQAVEFGHPHLLLKNTSGHFYQMVQQTGKSMAEKLAEISESAFLLSPQFRKRLIHSTNDQITHL